jgi:hypothetical protein
VAIANSRGGELKQLRRWTAGVLLVTAGQVRAQSAATVPASSDVYERLESVSAHFPVRGLFLGERSLSRREVERVVAALSRAIESAPSRTAARRAWARQELDAVTAALGDTRGTARTGLTRVGITWRADFFRSHALPERIESNGLGSIDAVTHPFVADRHGWPTVNGTIATLAPTGVAGWGNSAAMALQPSASLTAMHDGGWTSERFLHRAYARGVLFNVAMQLGADELRWGQSPHGALFISGNAMP